MSAPSPGRRSGAGRDSRLQTAKVAELLFDAGITARADRGFELIQFLTNLVAHAALSGQSKPTVPARLPSFCALFSAGSATATPASALSSSLSALSSALIRSQLPSTAPAARSLLGAEYVRVAPQHLVRNGPGNVVKIKQAGLIGHLCVKNDLEQQIPKFIPEGGEVLPRDSVGDFVGLLNRV